MSLVDNGIQHFFKFMLGALEGESIGMGEVFKGQDALTPAHGRRQFLGIDGLKVVFLGVYLQIRALADRDIT